MFNNEDEKSPHRRGKRWLLLTGAIALLLVSLLLWSLHSGPSVPDNTARVTDTALNTKTDTATTVKEGQPDPPIYWQTIEEHIAQNLHLTVAQVKVRLRPLPGQRDSPGMASVAREQGISEGQLRVIEINAIQIGHDLLVRLGILTQRGSDLGMQRIRNWDQATLDEHVTGWFLNN